MIFLYYVNVDQGMFGRSDLSMLCVKEWNVASVLFLNDIYISVSLY